MISFIIKILIMALIALFSIPFALVVGVFLFWSLLPDGGFGHGDK